MANTFDNISIKNKIIFGLLFTLFVSLGIGILQFNKIIKIQKGYKGRKVLTSYKSDFVKLQNLYYKLDAIVVSVSNAREKEGFINSSNRFKSVDIEISGILEELEGISISEISNGNTVTFLSSFNDSIFKYHSIYDEKIKLSIDKLIEYKYLTLHPEKINDDYKRLLAEQQSIGVMYVNYNDESFDKKQLVLELLEVYNKSVVDLSDFISKNLQAQTFSLEKISYNLQEEINTDDVLFASIRIDTIKSSAIIFFLSIIIIVILSFLISNNIIKPLYETNEIVGKLSKGNIPKNIDNKRTDEIGLILESLENLIVVLKDTSEFAKNLSNNNFDYNFTPSGEQDMLGNSLIHLRESLLQAKRDEEKRKHEDNVRSRTAEGLAKFSDILRQNQNNLKLLGREVISNFVKFLNANQGVIFLLNDEDKENVYLSLLSAYAWNREKFVEKKLKIGEGLIGAVAEEKFSVYMTDVPEDYIEIKSGTGAANPSSILIVPLKVDDDILGVVELASFQKFEKYEIILVEKIAESIASTLKSVRITAQTSDLLEKFQIQAAEMTEQETAMKATIDELRKSQNDRKNNEEHLRNTIREMEELNKQIQYKDEQLSNEVARLEKENATKLLQVEQSQKQSKEILQSMMTGVVIVKFGGHIDFVNVATEELWGYNEMEILGINVEKLFISPPDLGEKKLCEYFFENKEKFKLTGGKELFIQLKNGKTKKVVIEVMVLEAEDEEDMRMVVFVKDMARFERKNEKTDDFVSSLVKRDFENLMKLERYEEAFVENNLTIPEFEINNKELIKWGTKFEIGITIIDNQHKRWIEFINNLYEGLITTKSSEEIQLLYKKLIDYTEYHFGFEEKYMQEFKYGESDSHVLGHEKFVNSIVELFSDYIEGRADTVYNLILLLKKWVVNHVLVTDRKYVELFKKHGIR